MYLRWYEGAPDICYPVHDLARILVDTWPSNITIATSQQWSMKNSNVFNIFFLDGVVIFFIMSSDKWNG